ncbi:MAG: Flp family type IVb pilin [Rhizomicrobium sp.]
MKLFICFRRGAEYVDFDQAIRTPRRRCNGHRYGLIAALIAVVIIGAVTAVGTNLSTTFTNISASIK